MPSPGTGEKFLYGFKAARQGGPRAAQRDPIARESTTPAQALAVQRERNDGEDQAATHVPGDGPTGRVAVVATQTVPPAAQGLRP